MEVPHSETIPFQNTEMGHSSGTTINHILEQLKASCLNVRIFSACPGHKPVCPKFFKGQVGFLAEIKASAGDHCPISNPDLYLLSPFFLRQ